MFEGGNGGYPGWPPYGPPMGGVLPPAGAFAHPAAPGPNDTKDAAARWARGFQTPVQAQKGVQQVAAHQSPEQRVVRVQMVNAPANAIPNEVIVLVHVTHGVDAGVTRATAELVPWGVAFEVPAGEVKVSVEFISLRFPDLPMKIEGQTFDIATSIACGFLRTRHYYQTFRLAVLPDLYTGGSLPITISPPPFSTRCDVTATAGGGVTYQDATTNLIGVPGWTQTLNSLLAGNLPVSAYFAAAPVQIIGFTGAAGLVEFDWTIAE